MNETKALSTIDEIMESVFSEAELEAMEKTAELIAQEIRLGKITSTTTESFKTD